MERLNKEQSKANFQLSQKLMRQKVAHLNNAMPQDKATSSLTDLEDTEEWFAIDPVTQSVRMYTNNNPSSTGELDPLTASTMDPCPSHPATGDRKLKATFGRRRTHNEQVIVRPCGIICSRATFYGAEAVSNVLVSTVHPISLPYIDRYVAYGQENFLGPRSEEARACHLRQQLQCTEGSRGLEG